MPSSADTTPERPAVRSAGRVRVTRGISAVLQRGRLPERARLLVHAPGRAGCHALFALQMRRLEAGEVPADLGAAIVRLLARADADLWRGRGTWALEWFDQALQLAFHPSVHHGSRLSPLATEPDAFLAPFRASTVGRMMIARPDEPDEEEPSHPGGRRVLVVSHGSWTFADRLIEALEGVDAGLSVDRFDLSTLPAAERPSHRAVLRARWDLMRSGRRLPVPAALAEHLADVDTLVAEWGTYPLAWLSLMDLPPVRLVSRLHRFEAFTPYPMLTDFARVDEMLFVSPAVRGQVAEMAPRLEQAHSTRIVRNPHDYSPFVDRRAEGAERTLLQIGWAIPVKDVLFTLDVLDRLRREDPRWRLLLVGPEPAAEPLGRERSFVKRVRSRLAELGDAVEVLGRRDDVPELIARAGFIVSSSRHEGTHESVAEGAMAGCVPVVRDWPETARWGGAATIYPRAWVVSDVDAAVARILEHADPARRAAAGAAARTWALENRRAEDIVAPYIDAITGREAEER